MPPGGWILTFQKNRFLVSLPWRWRQQVSPNHWYQYPRPQKVCLDIRISSIDCAQLRTEAECMWDLCFRFDPNLVLGGTYSGQIVLWDNREQKRTPVKRTPLSASAHTVSCVTLVWPLWLQLQKLHSEFSVWFYFEHDLLNGALDGLVVKAPCYKPECRGYETRRGDLFNLPNLSGGTNRLCDLVMRVPGYSFWVQIQKSGLDSLRYQIFWEVVGLERGPLSLVSTTEELLDRKVAAPVQKTENTAVGISRADHVASYICKS
jgi:hypothetical protein